MFCKSGFPKESNNTWTIIPKTIISSGTSLENQHRKSNKIKTTKYTLLNFIPKNIFEQFHRFANMYFLFIIILNFIPQIGAFGKEVAMLPLLFVLAVTAIKDLIEDRQRYNSDKIVNNRLASVYSREKDEFVKKKWKDIEVGDLIMLQENGIIPCDMLLLHSSDENGMCYISTVNLDGESNLKQKKVPKGFLEEQNDFQCKKIAFQVKCEQPNSKLHSFYGYIVHQNGEEIGIDRNNLLLRGCVMKNTEYVYGLVIYAGHDTKALLNNSGPRYKRSRLEKDINKDVVGCVAILFIFCFIGALCCSFWTEDFLPFETIMSTNGAESSPEYEGFLRFWTFVIVLQVIIPISLYVSVEIVKLGQVFFMNRDEEMIYQHTTQYPVCRATNINEDLGQINYIFSDKTGTLTENKMLFKKFSIHGINYSHPDDTASDVTVAQCQKLTSDICKDKNTEFLDIWDEFFTALAICNTVVVGEKPDISQETTKTTLDDTDEDLTIKRLSFNGPLGKLVLFDQNETQCLPNSQNLIVPNLMDMKMPKKYSFDASNGDLSETIDMQRLCSYSKPINSRLSKSINSINSWLDYGLTPVYEYESPDEGALVKAACLYGYTLANRTSEQIIFSGPSGCLKIFDILQVLQFDSTRKRMSIIVRDDKGKVKIYSKGADTAIMMRLKEGQGDIREKTDEHLENFAIDGLRTLCVAKRDLSEAEYNKWLNNHKNLELALENRDSKLAESANAIETELKLLGATGIEDKLQDGVPETIAGLKNAGINIWILTGDKQETAVNIGFSCKLLNPNMEIITINARTKSDCCEVLDQISQRLNSSSPSYTILPTTKEKSDCSVSQTSLALIIDGISLSFTLEDPLRKKFIEIAQHCESVICCRAAPIQKAAVVQLVREHLKVMTLAIGDGANDVSMLQMAEIGVGIAGEEGVQAVMASDFVLGRFRFLKSLLLVHGFWCYDRIARMIIYFFYKNTMFIALLFWYQIFNGFSGSNAIDDVSLILFNLAFTSLPPIICGIFDQCVPRQAVLSRPLLYQWGQQGRAYTRKMFWLNILDAIFQSIVLFFIPYLTVSDMSFGMLTVGALYHQLAVFTANLHIGLETPNWTIVHAVIIVGSIVVSYLYYLIFCIIPPIFHMYWIIFGALSTSEFWFLNILCPVVALLPRALWKIFRISFHPTVIQKVQKQCNAYGGVGENGCIRTFSETSFRSSENAAQIATPT